MEVQRQPDVVSSAVLPPSSSARSCLTCAKAKAKCVRRIGQAHCDRCTRLRKECLMKEPVQRRRKPVKLTRTAQLENLESKLENLVHALSAQQAQQQQLGVEHGQPSPPESHTHSEYVVESACAYTDYQESISQQGGQKVTTGWSQNTTPGIRSENRLTEIDIGDAPLSLGEVESLFARYVKVMAPNMPFVYIPLETDATILANEKPFLMRVISTVAMVHDLPRQQAMGRGVMRRIAEKLLINGEKSIEVLQGILVYFTWYHPHLFINQQSSNLLHLAMALCNDLMINRAPGSCEKGRMMAADEQKPSVKVATNEERRALLGVYYASSMLATSFKKFDAAKWNTWMTECLESLEQSTETESDAYLVSIVRIQRLMEEAQSNNSAEAPARMYAKVLQGNLENMRVPPAPGRLRELLLQQKAVARIVIWEHTFGEPAERETSSTEIRQRIDGMWNCVEALRGYLDLYFAIPKCDYLTLPFQTFGQFAYIFMTMLRMSTLEASGWDVKMFREHLDLAALLETVSLRLEQVDGSVVDGRVVHNDAFTRLASKTRWMKNFYESKFIFEKSQQTAEACLDPASETRPGAALLQVADDTLGSQQQTPPDDPINNTANMPDFFTYFDDAFWSSFNPHELDFGLPEMQMG